MAPAPPESSGDVSDEPPRRTRGWVLPVKLAVSVGLLAVLVGRADTTSLWAYVRTASPAWLAGALGLYFLMVLASAWRWGLLLDAQGVRVSGRTLTGSFLVATFFNNFLPSNIGGDVVRIADTARPAGSKTLATTVVLMDRGLGLLGLVLLAAVASTVVGESVGPIRAWWLWVGLTAGMLAALPVLVAPQLVVRLLTPLRRLNPTWVDTRLERLQGVLGRFREAPGALVACFAGAVLVQAILVGFYAAIAHAVGVTVSPWHMAVLVPVSFLVQMLPISVNGFGLREATFSFYFARLGLPIEAGLVISLLGAGLIMLFSLTGAVVYAVRGS
jgi:uncharacterized protein (TIRG00374 family)